MDTGHEGRCAGAGGIQITLPARATAADMTSFLEGIKSTIGGRMVLVGRTGRAGHLQPGAAPP